MGAMQKFCSELHVSQPDSHGVRPLTFGQATAALGAMAVEQGNRTPRPTLSRQSSGFEDRAGHQARWLYRDRFNRGWAALSTASQAHHAAAEEIPQGLLQL
jgi:hypothetical protein